MNYWNMALLFSYDEPGPGDNPGHLNFLDKGEGPRNEPQQEELDEEDVPDPAETL